MNNFTNNKKNKQALLIILVLVVVILSGIYLFYYKEKNQSVESEKVNIFSTVQPSSLDPVGLYSNVDIYNDASNAYALGHYYQPFGGENSKLFE